MDVAPAREIPMVLNDDGTIGLSLNGKSFPAPSVHRISLWLIGHVDRISQLDARFLLPRHSPRL